MNHTCLILFFSFCLSVCFSQENLILNGDFEEYWECPDDETQIERCKHVYNPLYYPPPSWSSTSDYFNACSNSIVNLPNSGFGYQNARSGTGCLGFIISETTNFNYYYEYVQLEFVDEMKLGQSFQVSIFCNLANICEYTTQNIQFKFVNELNEYTSFLSDFLDPDYRNNILVTDTSNWVEIKFDYTAKGGEKYLIIGNFDTPEETYYEYLYDIPNTENHNYSYFFLDDATIIEKNTPIVLPNVFSPNNDGVNDFFEIIKGNEQVEKMTILNRWGNIVFESNDMFVWDGMNDEGENLSDGIYFVILVPKYYNKEIKDQYQGMIHLTR